MRRKTSLTIPALFLLGLGAFWTLACGGDTTTRAEDPAAEAPSVVEAPDVPGEAPPPSLGEPAESAAEAAAETDEELSTQERELALRERELELKERELALQEAQLAQQRAEKRRAPAASPPPAPAPVPVTPPAAEEAEESLAERDFEPEPIPEPEPEPREVLVQVPAGTQLEVEFQNHLASNASRPGDTFRARVIEPIYSGDLVAIPVGSEVVGRVTEAVSVENKVGGQARLTLEFTDLVLPSGVTAPISITFAEQGTKEGKKDAATIGGAAAAGALLGRILDRGDHKTKGTIIGAVIGAAAGTAVAAKKAGDEVEIPSGWVTRLALTEPVELRARR